MKSSDIRALHDQTIAELNEKLSSLQSEWIKAKLQKSAGKSENPSGIKNMADDVARIKTVIREKELVKQTEVKSKSAEATEEVA